MRHPGVWSRPSGWPGLTARQLELLALLYRADLKGLPLTIREAAAAMEMTSTNAVSEKLDALQQKGFLSRGAAQSRAIRLAAIPVFGGDPVRIVGFIPAGRPGPAPIIGHAGMGPGAGI